MSFLHPMWLLLSVLALPLAWAAGSWSARRRAARLRVFSALAQVPPHRLPPGWLLNGLGLAALGLALAGPLYGEREVSVRPTGADVMVALDISLSMAATDVKPSRLKLAVHQVEALLEALPGYRVGLVVFSGGAFLGVPLTRDHGALALFLDAVEPGMLPHPGSSLEAAVSSAAQAFGEGGGRALVILSDGETTVGAQSAAVAAARKAGLTVYGVGVGGVLGVPIPLRNERGQLTGYKRDGNGKRVMTRLQPAALQGLAAESGGSYHQADLSASAMEQVAEQVQNLDQGETAAAAHMRLENRYQWPLGLALILFLWEMAPYSRRRREVAG